MVGKAVGVKGLGRRERRRWTGVRAVFEGAEGADKTKRIERKVV